MARNNKIATVRPAREPKLTIKAIAQKMDGIDSAIREAADQIQRIRAYDNEKAKMTEEIQSLRTRLENANQGYNAAHARGEVLAGIVDRLLGAPDPSQIPERHRNGGDYEIPHSRPPRQGRCGSCGRF